EGGLFGADLEEVATDAVPADGRVWYWEISPRQTVQQWAPV
ncbi:uncharacterized protein METZ01_LOCUS453271, partial [marine metagenome]